MPVDAQINELYAWHGHITKLNGKNTIILMNDRTMYSLVFRNRLPRNVDKYMSGLGGNNICRESR